MTDVVQDRNIGARTRVGLVGYGNGGRLFHAPYIDASGTCDLVAIVARSDAAVAAVRSDYPAVAVFPTLTALLDAGAVDAVVISTPPATRRALVLEAIERGVAVVADKPFAPTAAAGQELVDRADADGVLLNVFHNRRRDADIETALAVLDSGRLGAVRGLDLRIDQDDPSTLEGGETGGLLRDLGSHVVDQALTLLGPATAVTAHLRWVRLDSGRTDAGFTIDIDHTSGARSRVSAGKIDHLVSKELRLYGELGSYVSDYSDVQFDDICRGRRPRADRESWGYEAPERWGVLRTERGAETVPSAQGDYAAFYDEFGTAVASHGAGPVPASEGVAVLRVLDAAVISDRERRTVEL